MQRKIALFVLLILFTPATLFAGDTHFIKTGYDLYRRIKLGENLTPQDDPMDAAKVFHKIGYLEGFYDSLHVVQTFISQNVFKGLPENEREKMLKDIKFLRVNLPTNGPNGEMLDLIYKKWAEKNPEKLQQPVSICIYKALIDSYGWK